MKMIFALNFLVNALQNLSFIASKYKQNNFQYSKSQFLECTCMKVECGNQISKKENDHIPFCAKNVPMVFYIVAILKYCFMVFKLFELSTLN